MKITFKKILAAAAIGVGVYAAVKAFKKFNAPIEQTMTVTDKRWSKVETVAEWGTENGEGWEVPDNAYDVESTLKYRDTSDVLTSALNVGVSAGKVFMNGEANDIVMTNVGTSAPKKELARYYTWKIDKVDLSVNADGKNIGFVKDGCNLEQIGKELIEQAKKLGANVTVDVAKLAGYNVKTVSFTTSNTFIVEFTGADPFKANISGISGYNFTYKLEIGTSNEILNAEAQCEFAPQTANTAWLTVKVNSDDFNGRVIFMMTVAD